MGKWLSVLKNIKNKELPNTQNPQNSKKCIFDDFEGSEYEQKQEKIMLVTFVMMTRPIR